MASKIKQLRGECSKPERSTKASVHLLDEIRNKASTMQEIRKNMIVDDRAMSCEDIIDQRIVKAAEQRAVAREQRTDLAYHSELQGTIFCCETVCTSCEFI